MRGKIYKLLLLINYLLYAAVLIWIGLFPVDIANPVHISRVEETMVSQPIYRTNIPREGENDSIIYKVDNYSTSLVEAMEAERHGIDEYHDVKDLVLRGMVFVPKGRGYGQIYQPIYEGASNKVMYYGAGTTHPFRYMGENHFTTIGHNMDDGYKEKPSFYSAMQEYDPGIIGTKFWSTDGLSIFEWKVDSAFTIPFYGGYIQDLDSQLPGAKYKSDEKPRFTLITCLVDDSYFTRRPENRIVMSGYLNGKQLIEDDYETAFKLFPELGVMKKVAYEKKNKIVTPILKEGVEVNDVEKTKQEVNYKLKTSGLIRFLFYNYTMILIGWGLINVGLLVYLIITSIRK